MELTPGADGHVVVVVAAAFEHRAMTDVPPFNKTLKKDEGKKKKSKKKKGSKNPPPVVDAKTKANQKKEDRLRNGKRVFVHSLHFYSGFDYAIPPAFPNRRVLCTSQTLSFRVGEFSGCRERSFHCAL